jgi:hypothetical protein
MMFRRRALPNWISETRESPDSTFKERSDFDGLTPAPARRRRLWIWLLGLLLLALLTFWMMMCRTTRM